MEVNKFSYLNNALGPIADIHYATSLGCYLLIDENGALFKIKAKTAKIEKLLTFDPISIENLDIRYI